MGFLSILRKALPHFADAENVIKAAKKDGAKGAAVAVVKALLSVGTPDVSDLEDAAIANAAAIDDHQQDLDDIKRRVASLEKQMKGKIK